jgi:hypothetical protein
MNNRVKYKIQFLNSLIIIVFDKRVAADSASAESICLLE